jgi:DNA repair photolyase
MFGMGQDELSTSEDFDYRDALPNGPAHRRGAGINPGNRFETVRLHVLGEEIDRQWVERQNEDGSTNRVQRQVFFDRTQRIINQVAKTSDVPFDWTLNPYRGCEHGCIYCFARPYHEFLGFSCGLDFETKLMAKPDAARLLKQELASPNWKPEPIVMSASTDVYQPIEHKMRITRQCLEVMADCGQPVTTMTKSALVLRDTDLWSRLADMNAGRVTVTLVTLDADLAQKLEPRASSPAGRLRAIRELTAAGIPVSVNVAPIIPGLTDTELPSILEAIAEAGARRAAWVLLRLPYQLKDLFLDWLQRNVHPDRAKKVESLIRQSRGGKLYDASKMTRRRGRGPMVDQLAQTFDVFTRKYGLNRDIRPLSTAHFRRPQLHGQMGLFPAEHEG